MSIEVVPLGQPKPLPYANSSPEERLEAAVLLIQHHQALRELQPALPRSTLPRSEWPGEIFIHGGERD